jgi:hypothetical protein
MAVKNDIYFNIIVKEKNMSWLKDWMEKRKLKRYMRKTPEEEYAIYKRRIIRGESEESARAGLKHLKKK